MVVCTAFFVMRFASPESDAKKNSDSIRSAVLRSARDCYVIEGCYPESLDYLTENYGLAVNTKDYRIIYIPYAENLPPEVKVVSRDNN